MDDVNTGTPHPARVYDALLGGTANFAADREIADAIRVNPAGEIAPLANRDFLRRAVAYLATEAGVDQFLDVGSGLPTSPNVHEVAQAIIPAARIVYVDNDPIVLVHARTLLSSTPEGSSSYVDADVRDPGTILAAARQTLDFERPVALLLLAVGHFLDDEHDPYGVVGTLLDALPAGSYLAMTHLTGEFQPDETAKTEAMYRAQGMVLRARTRDEFARFFDGLELVEPGVVLVPRWRPDADDRVSPDEPGERAPLYGAVGRKL
ncbi:SAM-dependent methyltransferase [Cryptosporangium phraense]|uniref:SAM-dependent methyltransferase n=1 Tax=Cryptosporangium phraense TaxID=2593070 RepID=A0A545ASU2_9ACTN|nr:SAM-dependent methyltransferase [Cryptosporangium phraense]TQS44409.1 SAM-dependent methyltransferase [Cryptosporangium phraense]